MITIEELKGEYHLTDEQLDTVIAPDKLLAIASLFGPWPEYCSTPGLDLDDGERFSIIEDHRLVDNKMKMKKALDMWLDKNTIYATFGKLLNILIDLQKGKDAMAICGYISKT